METKKIIVPIYNFTIYFTVFDKWEEVAKIYGSDTDQREGFLVTNDKYPTILKMFVCADCESTVIHEIIHIKNEIFRVTGIQNDYNNDEPETYLVQFLYEKLINIFRAHNKKDNTNK